MWGRDGTILSPPGPRVSSHGCWGSTLPYWGLGFLEDWERWAERLVPKFVPGSTGAHFFQWTLFVSWCIDATMRVGRTERLFWTGAPWQDLWSSRSPLISKTCSLLRACLLPQVNLQLFKLYVGWRWGDYLSFNPFSLWGSNFLTPYWNVSIQKDYSIIKQTVEKLKYLNEHKQISNLTTKW